MPSLLSDLLPNIFASSPWLFIAGLSKPDQLRWAPVWGRRYAAAFWPVSGAASFLSTHDKWTRVGVLNSFLRLSNTPTLVLWEKVLLFQAFFFLMCGPPILSQRWKSQAWWLKSEKYPVLNPLPRSACPLSPLRMEQFEPIRCLIVERAVGALGVVKFYISINASHELTLGVILGPINLLSFHGGKEGLGYSIVMGTAELRERLDNLVHTK